MYLIKLVVAAFYGFLIWEIFKTDFNQLSLKNKLMIILLGIPFLVIEFMILRIVFSLDEPLVKDIFLIGMLVYTIFLILSLFHALFVRRSLGYNKQVIDKANFIFNAAKTFFCLTGIVITVTYFFFK